MQFHIADSFLDSLAKLTNAEQKAVKTTTFDLHTNPASTGHQFHKLTASLDKHFCSVRVNRDIRIIAHRLKANLLLCYVDHHDAAYQWAARRKLETHPKTGALQMVEVETRAPLTESPAKPITEPLPKPAAPRSHPYQHLDAEQLLEYGVPADWLSTIKDANDDSILDIAERLPGEAAEALLAFAVGAKPQVIAPVVNPYANPYRHPDTQRRFRGIRDSQELAAALDAPWAKWSLFLHPAQRKLVEQDFAGPARVLGSAGTGKTIVALHRAVFLATNNPRARVLLTTFSTTLANALKHKLRLMLKPPQLAERIDVETLDNLAARLYNSNMAATARRRWLSHQDLADLVAAEYAAATTPPRTTQFAAEFVLQEWLDVVDARQLDSWPDYRDAARPGRRTRLTEAHRKPLWDIFAAINQRVAGAGISTAGVYAALRAFYTDKAFPYRFIVVDEAQDLSIPQLRWLAAVGGALPNALFFCGDLGQRIFQPAFSWQALGVDVRGRTTILQVNYRTSHQIRQIADKLLEPSVADADGNADARSATVSAFNGPPPQCQQFDAPDAEIAAVAAWLSERVAAGLEAESIGVFVRSEAQYARAEAALAQANLAYTILDHEMQLARNSAHLGSLHLAKGLEFNAVAIMACDDQVIPSAHRLAQAADAADRAAIYETERHLFYVGCTRARQHLLITSGGEASEFLLDIMSSG